MIVAVGAMGMMEVPVDEVVDVVPMRNGLVSATRSMLVTGVVTRAGMIRSAGGGIGRADLEHMLVDVIAVRLMQVAVMQVVHVIAMFDCDVAAAGAVNMGMPFMDSMFVRHWDDDSFSRSGFTRGLPPRGRFTGVGQCVENHFGHVGIGQGVVDVLAGPAPYHDVFGAQNAQPLRDRGQTLLAGVSKFRHAGFPLRQRRNDSQPRLLAQCAKESCGTFERLIADQTCAGALGMFVIAAARNVHGNT